eukprot:scaffold279011_cov28-Tisochrysis_lutea.AAC.6
MSRRASTVSATYAEPARRSACCAKNSLRSAISLMPRLRRAFTSPIHEPLDPSKGSMPPTASAVCMQR